MKKITFRADEDLIDRAHKVTSFQNRTLNAAFREWLFQFTHQAVRAKQYDALMKRLRRNVHSSGPYTRDELNER